MQNQVHIAVQIVSVTRQDSYSLIDKAIEVIDRSGIEYRVGAMETVLQGDYDAIMKVIKEAQQVCLDAGADEIVVTLKVHAKRNDDVTWEQKLAKYS